MTTTTKAVATKPDDKFTEFVPFGSEDKIKLSVGMIQNLIAVRTKRGETCSNNDAIKFIAMCQARRLNPFEGDAYLLGYDTKEGPKFSLITAHQAFLKRAERHPEFDGMQSGIIVMNDDEGTMAELEGDFHTEHQTVVGGWARVFFKNRKQPMYKRLRLARFQKEWGIWQEDPAGMICKCAEADALRSSFPTMLGGLYIKEENDTPGEPKPPNVVSPIFTNVESEPVTPVADPEPTKEEPQTPVSSNPSSVIKGIREKLAKNKVTESILLARLMDMGVCDPVKSLEEMHAADETSLDSVAKNIDDLITRIKEGK